MTAARSLPRLATIIRARCGIPWAESNAAGTLLEFGDRRGGRVQATLGRFDDRSWLWTLLVDDVMRGSERVRGSADLQRVIETTRQLGETVGAWPVAARD